MRIGPRKASSVARSALRGEVSGRHTEAGKLNRLRKNALFGRQFGELLYLTRALVAVNRL